MHKVPNWMISFEAYNRGGSDVRFPQRCNWLNEQNLLLSSDQFINPSLLDLTRFPINPPVKPSTTVNAREVQTLSDDNGLFVQDDDYGNINSLPPHDPYDLSHNFTYDQDDGVGDSWFSEDPGEASHHDNPYEAAPGLVNDGDQSHHVPIENPPLHPDTQPSESQAFPLSFPCTECDKSFNMPHELK
ncbi:hypothetical protein ACMFMF_006308 [Clarireedia jacksonii]